jgi:hypothetical protein
MWLVATVLACVVWAVVALRAPRAHARQPRHALTHLKLRR